MLSVVTEIVLFSIVASKTHDISQGSVATHLSALESEAVKFKVCQL